MTSLSIYLMRASVLPPHVVADKALRLIGRSTRARLRRLRDRHASTFAADAAGSLARLVALDAAAVPRDIASALPGLCTDIVAHRFDLLGSGPVIVEYGLEAVGLDGHRYPAGPAVDADPAGDWLAARVSPANLPESRRLWTLVEGGYAPIDWQCDFKSGYRWDARGHFSELHFGRLPGVDVKVPWELARLQHLPQLATAFLLAADGRAGFGDARVYSREVRNQILDFLAANPPRYGINWRGPMDVAIRAANMLLAVDLLRAGGWQPDRAFETALARAAVEHARHVLDNLEWSAETRGNHYLSQLVGLLFCAATLPASAETDDWLAFAAQQLGQEIAFQFHADGGNFEGSTNYHRLSTEAALFAAALLAGIAGDRAAAFARPPSVALRVRPPRVPAPPPATALPDGAPVALPRGALDRLAGAVAATAGWLKPDGRAPQIGDTDSGRLFVLHPADPLDHRAVLAIGGALFGKPAATGWFEAAIAGALARGRRLTGDTSPSGRVPVGAKSTITETEAAIRALPAGQRREWVFDLPGLRPDAVTAHAFPDFGLYVLRSATSYVALRCADYADATDYGHTHDDNLALELFHNGRDMIVDPGSLLYTPAPETRNAYRAAAAHFAPRPAAGRPAATALAPFAIRHDARATCLYFGPGGVVARLDGPGWSVLRSVRLEPDRIIVADGCPEMPLAEDRTASGAITVSEGYGRRTARPVRSV